MIQKTQVHQMEQELLRSGVSGEALQRKFRTASRADSKLACALLGYFAEGNESYLPYLRSRIRPVLMELTLSGRVRELAALEAAGLLTAPLVEACLEAAIAAGAPESTVWLIKCKERNYGFRDRIEP